MSTTMNTTEEHVRISSESMPTIWFSPFLWIDYAFGLYLCMRQSKVYSSSKDKVPKELRLDKKTFEKSRLYEMDQHHFLMFLHFYMNAVVTALSYCSGWSRGLQLIGTFLEFSNIWLWPTGWDKEIGKGVCFCVIVILFLYAVGLPLSIYWTFWLEERHGFNKKTVGFFIKDTLKSILVNAIIAASLVVLIGKMEQLHRHTSNSNESQLLWGTQLGGNFLTICLAIFFVAVLVFLIAIFPIMIAPLFDKYTPLKDGPLRERVEALAGRMKFPVTKLYVVEGSKRSAHSNAYFYGLFNKRIVLYDTLIKGYVKEHPDDKKEENGESPNSEKMSDTANSDKGCSDEEVEAVLGHELGHWKLYHVIKSIVILEGMLLLLFFLIGLVAIVCCEAFGFSQESTVTVAQIVLLVLIQIYKGAFFWLSRKFEFEADEFSVQLGYGKDLKGALMKLDKDNLTFPITDPLYSAWFHTHPPLLQRLQAIDDAMKKSK